MIEDGQFTAENKIQTLGDKVLVLVLVLGNIQDTVSDVDQFIAPLDPTKEPEGITEYMKIHTTISR